MANFSLLFGAAQTDFMLVPTAPRERLTITRVAIYCDNANSVDVGCTIGFGKTAQQPFTGHPGIAAGSGFIELYAEGVVEGDLGEHLLFTCETPTGGGIRVSGSYQRHIFER